MKKNILLIIVVLLAVFVAWYFFPKNEQKPVEEPKDIPLAIQKNSSKFEQSLARVLNKYYDLRDALVDWDTVRANQAARELAQVNDSLPFSELKGDSGIVLTAKSFGTSIQAEIKGFLGEDSILQKRRSFNMLTDELYNILRTVQYSGHTVYHIKCPMAFNENDEGYWLSNDSKIINPYLGKKHPEYKDKMTGCGEVVDSLDFVKKDSVK